MAKDNFFTKDWEDKNALGKVGTVAMGVPGLAVKEGIKMWNGDQSRLDDINAQAAELENSPYNTATVTQENQDYYKNAAMDYAKAKREAGFGFTPEQKAEANQNFAEKSNLSTQNAISAGGNNLANYINANMNTNANKFATSMASEDAGLKMQKQQQVLNYLNTLGNAASVGQDVATQNFQKNMLAEQAIGQAEKDWYASRDANRQSLINAGTSLAGQAIGIAAKAGGV